MSIQRVVRQSAHGIATLAVGLIVFQASAGRADEAASKAEAEPKVQKSETDRDSKPVDADAGKAAEQGRASTDWIGVALELEDKLKVADVSPEGPAAAAGLKAGDMILAFGDQSVNTLPELVAAIEAAQRQPTEVKVLRDGEELTLEVKPERRPEPTRTPPVASPFRPGEPLDVDKLREMIRQWTGEGGRLPAEQAWEWYRLRPGIVIPESRILSAQFPKSTSITVTRQEDERLMIRVEHDGKTYEVTDQELGQLPEALRRTVQQMLGGPFGPRVLIEPSRPGAVPRIEVQPPRIPRLRTPARDAEVADEQAATLKELEEKFEALRREVQELKKGRENE